jgi:hypothetical protein
VEEASETNITRMMTRNEARPARAKPGPIAAEALNEKKVVGFDDGQYQPDRLRIVPDGERMK